MVKLLGDMREVFEDFRFGDCDRHVPSMDRLQLKEEILRELRLHLGQRHVVTLNNHLNLGFHERWPRPVRVVVIVWESEGLD